MPRAIKHLSSAFPRTRFIKKFIKTRNCYFQVKSPFVRGTRGGACVRIVRVAFQKQWIKNLFPSRISFFSLSGNEHRARHQTNSYANKPQWPTCHRLAGDRKWCLRMVGGRVKIKKIRASLKVAWSEELTRRMSKTLVRISQLKVSIYF